MPFGHTAMRALTGTKRPREDSNLPPPTSEAGALSTELRGQGTGGGTRTLSGMHLLYRQARLSDVGAPAWGDWPESNRRIQGHVLALSR